MLFLEYKLYPVLELLINTDHHSSSKNGRYILQEVENEDFYIRELLCNLDEQKASRMNQWLDDIRK